MRLVAEPETLPVQAAREGNPEAWDTLFKRYQLPLFAYVHDLVRNEQTSLDIVQETFVSALRHLESLREDASFGSWLFGIARQKCVQEWRRQGRRPEQPFEPGLEELPDPDPGPEEWVIRREEQAAFLAALDHLPAAQREVLTLHFLEDFPLEDIAAITGVPLGTVKSRMHFAKQGLRKLMKEHDV